MEVFVSQIWCFNIVDKLAAAYFLPDTIQMALMVTLPYGAAIVLYYLIERPGARFVNALFERHSTKR